jgi:hypothetical protein
MRQSESSEPDNRLALWLPALAGENRQFHLSNNGLNPIISDLEQHFDCLLTAFCDSSPT